MLKMLDLLIYLGKYKESISCNFWGIKQGKICQLAITRDSVCCYPRDTGIVCYLLNVYIFTLLSIVVIEEDPILI